MQLAYNDAAPRPGQNMGEPLPRIDGRLKVTGEARFSADLPLNNLAYGVLVTSTIARGSVAKTIWTKRVPSAG